MKRDIESFLLRQLSDPLAEKLLDLPKRATVLESLTYEGRTYLGSNDWVTIQHGGKPGKIRRSQLGTPAEIVEAAGSLIKDWREQRKVQLITNGSFESGPVDVYSVDGRRGFRHWDEPDASLKYNIEPESEFSDLWVPCRRLGPRQGIQKPRQWSEIFYLPWRCCTGWPLIQTAAGAEYAIDLAGSLQAQHEKVVSSAY